MSRGIQFFDAMDKTERIRNDYRPGDQQKWGGFVTSSIPYISQFDSEGWKL